MAEDEAVPEDAVDLVDDQVEVGVVGEFAAFAAAGEEVAQGGAAGGGEGLHEVGEVGVAGGFADEGAQGGGGGVALGAVEGGGDEGAEVGAQGAGVGAGDVLVGAVGEGVEQDGALGRPPAVDGLLADAGAAGDGVDGDGGAVGLGEQVQGRIEDRLVGGLVAAASGVRAGFGHGVPFLLPPLDKTSSLDNIIDGTSGLDNMKDTPP